MEESDEVILRKFRDNFQNEYYRNQNSNKDFWLADYDNSSLNQRLKFWFIEIVRYEYMMGGEFNSNSIEERANLITQAIKDKDKKHNLVLKALYEKLKNNALQVDEISQYFAEKIKEYGGLDL